jgi:2-deoxy-D-gluconate 3-dehydrogenase
MRCGTDPATVLAVRTEHEEPQGEAMADWGPFDLSGKSAIVTGGAMGIGFGIASRMTEAGANVLVADLDEAAAKGAIETLADHRGNAVVAQADVSDPATGAQLAERCVAEFGSVDILVNNAGIYPIVPFAEVDPAVFDRIISVNYKGLLFTSQGVAQRMIEQGTGGAIVNIASIDGIHPSFPGLSTYGSSKAAVIQLTKNMAVELSPHRIRVCSIAPGAIETEGAQRLAQSGEMDEAERQAIADAMVAKMPIGRMGNPDDIAKVAVFLASSAADYMTGENVLVDGGYLLG